MQWTEPAIVLGRRAHGETSAVIDVLAATRGRYRGLLKGGGGGRRKISVEPGDRVIAHWQARLSDHLGSFRLEADSVGDVSLFASPGRLSALATLCAFGLLIPERDPCPAVFSSFSACLAALSGAQWAGALIRFELTLLRELGFGLDLTHCAVTGERENLTHVSPRSGRAVSAAVAAPYAERLLPLPRFLIDADAPPPDRAELLAGFALTGHFLQRRLFADPQRPLPFSRQILARCM